MGSDKSKPLSVPESSNVECIREKYGRESVECVALWTEKYGFPAGGSLSLNELKRLNEKLTEREKKLRNKKKICVKDLEECEKHRRCFNAWEAEAQRKERKQRAKELPGIKDKTQDVVGRTENASLHMNKPPPYTGTSSVYSVPELSALRMDPDLDACPPPSAPPSTSRNQQTDPSTPVVVAQPTPVRRSHANLGASSPMHTRLQTKLQQRGINIPVPNSGDEEAAQTELFVNAPMVEVAGPAGTILVHRPWADSDVASAAELLPDPVASGLKFSEALDAFCKEFRPTGAEIRRLLAKKFKASDLQKINDKLPQPHLRPVNCAWNDTQNNDYNVALTTLVATIKEKFPPRVDMHAVNTCKQRPGELTDDYIHRLIQVFNTHSGHEQPALLGERPGTWESQLCDIIFKGLLPDISAKVKTNYIGWAEQARLDDVQRHARHAQQLIEQDKKTKENKASRDIHTAALTMFSAVSGQHSTYAKGKDRGRGHAHIRGRRKQENNRDVCFKCGKTGHWRDACPERQTTDNIEHAD